jgi:hypothetical protein
MRLDIRCAEATFAIVRTGYYRRATQAFADRFAHRSARFSRGVGYGLILFGMGLFAAAAYDAHRGVSSVTPPRREAGQIVVNKDEHPKHLHGVIIYQCALGALLACAGTIIVRFCRHSDCTDPFSSRFAGNAALDELNRVLTKEEERRHHPLR